MGKETSTRAGDGNFYKPGQEGSSGQRRRTVIANPLMEGYL